MGGDHQDDTCGGIDQGRGQGNTGNPHGPLQGKAGDKVEVTIEGIGSLVNTVVNDPKVIG